MKNLAIVLTGVFLTVAALWQAADNNAELSSIFKNKRAIASMLHVKHKSIQDNVEGLVNLKVGKHVKVVQENWTTTKKASL